MFVGGIVLPCQLSLGYHSVIVGGIALASLGCQLGSIAAGKIAFA